MRVVSDTSPICNLAIIARLDLLQLRYQTIFIPQEVADELSALSHSAAKDCISAAIACQWIIVKPSPAITPHLSSPLDSGETAAIALAYSEKSDILLIDEKRGREAARALGIKVAGVLGELIHARRAGRISSLKAEIEALRKEARFFVDAEVEKFVLAEVGE
jgi:predicted nucleic acid-binding protein